MGITQISKIQVRTGNLDEQPVLKQAFTESKYLSMEKNIPMWIQQYSSFDNFTITFQ
jgi:hypothetical protein